MMSEYQYYEFCSLYTPLTADARNEMYSLTSRAKVNTHTASYVYNYGEFRGDPKRLLRKYFDIFFYLTNWGTFQLMFKYPEHEVDISRLVKYCMKDVISCEIQTPSILLDIHFHQEEEFGWVEGEGMLAEILPLYEEIKLGNYQFLHLIQAINQEDAPGAAFDKSQWTLSATQAAFLKYAGIDDKIKKE